MKINHNIIVNLLISAKQILDWHWSWYHHDCEQKAQKRCRNNSAIWCWIGQAPGTDLFNKQKYSFNQILFKCRRLVLQNLGRRSQGSNHQNEIPWSIFKRRLLVTNQKRCLFPHKKSISFSLHFLDSQPCFFFGLEPRGLKWSETTKFWL